ncbi:condensation domain-containing protein [Streptomyces sp. B21-102]
MGTAAANGPRDCGKSSTPTGSPPWPTRRRSRPFPWITPPEVPSHRGGLVEFALDADLTRRLRGLGRRFKATPFVVYAAAVTALLARHGQQDVVLGTPVSRRDGPELEPMIACLTDVMPLRQTVEPARSFGELVLHTKETVRSVTAHKDVPYTMLVQQTGAPRSRSRPPLFQVVLTVDDAPAPGLSLPGAQAERLYPHDGTAKFDVFFHLIRHATAGSGGWSTPRTSSPLRPPANWSNACGSCCSTRRTTRPARWETSR